MNKMSRTPVIVFTLTVIASIAVIGGVFYQQAKERFLLHQGVIRDIERQNYKKQLKESQMQD